MSQRRKNPFYGKYRGKVTDNKDVTGQGKIEVEVEAIYGKGNRVWAFPCTPFAGDGVGMFFLPSKGTNVWVECEAGDPDIPIWSGCFWDPLQCPAYPESTIKDIHIIKTKNATITFDDTSKKLVIETQNNMKISMDLNGMSISNNLSTLKLSIQDVSINNNSFKVMTQPG